MMNNWHILTVKPNAGTSVEQELGDCGMLALSFFSEKTVKHHRTKRELKKVNPIFPGYVFVLCSIGDMPDVLGIDGVTGFLGAAGDDDPSVIEPSIVIDLLRRERHGDFRSGKGSVAFEIGDIVLCNVLGEETFAKVVDITETNAILEADINGKRIVFSDDAAKLRAT